MNKYELFDLIGEAEEKYVDAADIPAKRARPRWRTWAACAACAALLAGAYPAYRALAPGRPPLHGYTVEDGSGLTAVPEDTVKAPAGSGTDAPASEPVPQPDQPHTPRLTIDLAQVAVNELTGDQPQGALRADFHLTHQEVVWGQDEIEAWFGKTDFTPAFVPEDLIPARGNNTATVFTRDGEVAIDLLRLGFYVDYYEDGGPKSTDECVYARGFNLSVSRHSTHPFRDWAVHEPTVETSDIAGTDVTVTHKSYPYGPYDPDTHEPSGYYDWYSAEFTLDGLNYEITAQRLTLEEVVSVCASIVTGGTDFAVQPPRGDGPDAPADRAPYRQYNSLLENANLDQDPPEWYGGAYFQYEDGVPVRLAICIVEGYHTAELQNQIWAWCGAGELSFPSVKYSRGYLQALMERMNGADFLAVTKEDPAVSGWGVYEDGNCVRVDCSAVPSDVTLAALAELDPDGDAIQVRVLAGLKADPDIVKGPAPGGD